METNRNENKLNDTNAPIANEQQPVKNRKKEGKRNMQSQNTGRKKKLKKKIIWKTK